MTTTNAAPTTTIQVMADSSGLVSLVNPSDSNHKRALRAIERLAKQQGSIIVPADVFSETINVVGRKLGHEVALAVAERLLSDATFIMAESDAELRVLALDMFRAQPDSVSYTDCLVMAYAQHFDSADIFGFDSSL